MPHHSKSFFQISNTNLPFFQFEALFLSLKALVKTQLSHSPCCNPNPQQSVSGFQTRECCAGFFGQQCQPCPGKAGSACFGNGVCLDGINGTGACQCEEGFAGTACESCSQGKYGPNCDQGTEHPKPGGSFARCPNLPLLSSNRVQPRF